MQRSFDVVITANNIQQYEPTEGCSVTLPSREEFVSRAEMNSHLLGVAPCLICIFCKIKRNTIPIYF